ncbi:MAG: hypothetical protein PSV13_00855, partial [Lacunisphaera sp.]|nr:hypothetical protein [Lacunisphaera sp.]
DQTPPPQALIPENYVDLGPATRAMLRDRAVELALSQGRAAHEVAKADWDQARQELAGEVEAADLKTDPEWDPVPGSSGHQAVESPCEEEDGDGHNESAQLVDEGVDAAAREQRLQAAKAGAKQDHRAK